jgi:outer membrane receptor for ferric coprogen and ferric-rhodotorulic acid
VQGSIANIENMLFYVQDSSSFQKIIYDEGKVTLTTFTADLSYQIGEKWRLALIAKVYSYSMSKLQFAYSRPNTEVKLNTSYNIADKFMIRADIFYIGERTGGVINPSSGNKDAISEIKLNPFVDLNLGIDYRYNKNVSVFVNCNNMAAARYMRFTNYDVYGFNILGGLTLTF